MNNEKAAQAKGWSRVSEQKGAVFHIFLKETKATKSTKAAKAAKAIFS